jgi:hypothetical protein
MDEVRKMPETTQCRFAAPPHRNVATTRRYLGSTDTELKELYKRKIR